MRRIIKMICFSVSIMILFGSLVTVRAGTSWDSMSADKQELVKTAWNHMLKKGYTEVAAAAVLGNCNQESDFNHMLDCDPLGAAVISAKRVSLFQFEPKRWYPDKITVNTYYWWLTTKALKPWSKEWSNICNQIDFIEYSCTSGYRQGPWKNFAPGDLANRNEEERSKLSGTGKGEVNYAYFKAYKGSVDEATAIFAAGFEGCLRRCSDPNHTGHETLGWGYNRCWQELNTRRKYANEIYNALKGTIPENTSSDSSDSSSEGSSEGSENSTDGTSGSESIELLMSSWLKDEYNEDWGIYEHITTTLIPLPDGSGLDANEKAQLQVWKEILETEDEFSILSFLRTCVAFVGILLVIYATLVYLAYWVDRVNNFVAFSCLNALTMGRLMISPDDNSSTFTPSNKNVKAVVHRDIVFVSLLGIAIGVILLSGRIYLIIDFFIEFAKDVLG